MLQAQLGFVLELLQIELLDFRVLSFKINLLDFFWILTSGILRRRGWLDCSSEASFDFSFDFYLNLWAWP